MSATPCTSIVTQTHIRFAEKDLCITVVDGPQFPSDISGGPGKWHSRYEDLPGRLPRSVNVLTCIVGKRPKSGVFLRGTDAQLKLER